VVELRYTPRILYLALDRAEWLASRPGRIYPKGSLRYPLDRRLDGPQSRPGRGGDGEKSLSFHCQKLNTGRPARRLVTTLTELPHVGRNNYVFIKTGSPSHKLTYFHRIHSCRRFTINEQFTKFHKLISKYNSANENRFQLSFCKETHILHGCSLRQTEENHYIARTTTELFQMS
jgi:hypothetical protein